MFKFVWAVVIALSFTGCASYKQTLDINAESNRRTAVLMKTMLDNNKSCYDNAKTDNAMALCAVRGAQTEALVVFAGRQVMEALPETPESMIKDGFKTAGTLAITWKGLSVAGEFLNKSLDASSKAPLVVDREVPVFVEPTYAYPLSGVQ